jgi:hypothetical protein
VDDSYPSNPIHCYLHFACLGRARANGIASGVHHIGVALCCWSRLTFGGSIDRLCNSNRKRRRNILDRHNRSGGRQYFAIGDGISRWPEPCESCSGMCRACSAHLRMVHSAHQMDGDGLDETLFGRIPHFVCGLHRLGHWDNRSPICRAYTEFRVDLRGQVLEAKVAIRISKFNACQCNDCQPTIFGQKRACLDRQAIITSRLPASPPPLRSRRRSS